MRPALHLAAALRDLPVAPLIALLVVSSSCAEVEPTGGDLVDSGGWEIAGAPSGDLEVVDVRYMARGYFFAKSAFPDREALGGFAQSDNEPRRLARGLPGGKLLLIARPQDGVAFDGRYQGLRVILANTTSKTIALEASDSRLPIVREALDADGRWRPIEYLPRSWCGNSYHRVFLPRNHYWSFAAPRYDGSEATVMRFALQIKGDGGPIYSNEFAGSVYPEQFEIKPGHTPTGIMDPYLD